MPKQKKPLTYEQLEWLRSQLKGRQDWRSLALLETQVSTGLRASDVLGLRVNDVQLQNGAYKAELVIRMQKTKQDVTVYLEQDAQGAIDKLIMAEFKTPNDYLFTRKFQPHGCRLTVQAYGHIVKDWAKILGVPEEDLGTHSLRRTKASYIYKQTGNIEAVRQFLGHTSISQTQKYLGVQQEEVKELSRKFSMGPRA